MNIFKLLTLTVAAFMYSGLFAQTHNDDVCSQKVEVCVHYETDRPFTIDQEARFELHLESPNNEAQLKKTDLWMQMGNHGHGSSPLKVNVISPGVYDVTKAFFVMRGQWQIRVTFEYRNSIETLVIPVVVK